MLGFILAAAAGKEQNMVQTFMMFGSVEKLKSLSL